MNNRFTSSIVVMLALLVAAPAYAATISLSPTAVSVKKGQNISITVNADPTGSKLYTVKSAVSFSTALLEEISFAQSSGWVPLTMAGYDAVDNVNGLVVKTAGYPGGFSSATAFGKLSFRAKESGVAYITVTSASAAYDAQNKNILSDVQGSVTVTISQPAAVAVAPAPTKLKPQPVPEPLAPESTSSTSNESSIEEPAPVIPTDSNPIITQESEANPSLLASVSSVMTLGTDSLVIGITVGIVLLAIICYLIYVFMGRKKRRQF